MAKYLEPATIRALHEKFAELLNLVEAAAKEACITDDSGSIVKVEDRMALKWAEQTEMMLEQQMGFLSYRMVRSKDKQ